VSKLIKQKAIQASNRKLAPAVPPPMAKVVAGGIVSPNRGSACRLVRDPEPRFREILNKNGRITETEMTFEQTRALDPQDVDFHCDEVIGHYVIRRPDGPPIVYEQNIPHIGKKHGRVLFDIMFNAGQLRTPRCVAPLLGGTFYSERHLRGVVSAILSRIRLAFHEGAKGHRKRLGKCSRSWFIISRRYPYGFGWNAARSWRILESLATPSREPPP
jgi:hypothetical protein